MMFRDLSRQAPHNLYAHVDQMYSRCRDPAPPSVFAYRIARAPVVGFPAASVRVGFLSGFAVTWTWDPSARAWKRFIFNAPEIAASGAQLAATNVVVLFTQYVGGDPNNGNEGAEATLTGQGVAWLFTAGRVVKGTWTRPDKSKPAQFFDASHRTMRLTPGQTWVELPDVSYSVTVTP